MNEQEATSTPELVRCPFCNAMTPPGAFCANCGRAIGNDDLAASTLSDTKDDLDGQPEGRAGDESAEIEPTLVPEDRAEQKPYPPTVEAPPAASANLAKRSADPIEEAAPPSGGTPIPSEFGFEGDQGRRPLRDYRLLAGAAILAILISLLLNNAGIAILLSVFLIPGLALLWITDLDLFERESWSAIVGALAGGFGVGLIFGTIGAWLTGAFWIEGATFYAGAAGYAARFAEAEGSAPIGWVILGGVVLPALALIASAAIPVFMRRWPSLRNEVMDGVTLGAAAGGGFAAATTIVHFWPAILRDQNPGGSISDWTATLTGLIIVRPLIFAGLTAVLCAAIWQYAIDQRSSPLVRSIISSVGGVIVFAVIDLLIQPAGAAAELIWQLAVLLGVSFAIRVAIRRALAQDRIAFGKNGDRIICPTCRRLTPDGQFCASCGAPLHPAKSTATATATLPSTTDQ